MKNTETTDTNNQLHHHLKGNTRLPKRVKKLYYETIAISLRTLVVSMLIGGLVLALGYDAILLYQKGAAAEADLSLFYGEIAEAQYPDKSRFNYYDVTELPHIEAALEKVQEQGIYTDFTAADLQKCFVVNSKLDSSVRDDVAYAVSEGADFTYVANEYTILFTQPRVAPGKHIFNGFLWTDHSEIFLNTLMDVYYNYIVSSLGGTDGFQNLTDIGEISSYDYEEQVEMFNTRINILIAALDHVDSANKDFISPVHNRSLKDVMGEFRLLRTTLSSIQNFIDSSSLTRDSEIACNKLNTNLSDTQVNRDRSQAIYTVNKTAQDIYDHTFTENLIIVARQIYGDKLYQARPKTGFDDIVKDKQEGMADVAYYNEHMEDISEKLVNFGNAPHSQAEYKRLAAKCEEMLASFYGQYKGLCEIASEVVSESYSHTNGGFLQYEIEPYRLLSLDLLVDNAILFLTGAAGMFVLNVIFNSVGEACKHRKKEKIIEKLQKA